MQIRMGYKDSESRVQSVRQTGLPEALPRRILSSAKIVFSARTSPPAAKKEANGRFSGKIITFVFVGSEQHSSKHIYLAITGIVYAFYISDFEYFIL